MVGKVRRGKPANQLNQSPEEEDEHQNDAVFTSSIND
jgi:hypothetical protein